MRDIGLAGDERLSGTSLRLNAAERDLVAAMLAGDVAAPLADQGPAPDPADEDGWDGRVIRASVIAALVTGERSTAGSRGLRLRGALVEGPLDLTWAELRRPLRLERCRIPERVLLVDARAKEIVFTACELGGGVDASRLRSEGCVDLSGCTLGRNLSLHDADLGAELRLTGAHLPDDAGSSLLAQGIRVRADVWLNAGFTATGQVSLDEARISRSLRCDTARFEASAGAALSARGATIEGDMSCAGARLESPRGALSLEKAEVKIGVDLSLAYGEDGAPIRFEAIGGASLAGATIGGKLMCRGGVFSGTSLPALNLERVQVRGSVFLDRAMGDDGGPIRDPDGNPLRFEANGAVSLVGADLGASLLCSGGRFTNPRAQALSLYGAHVAGDVFLEAPLDGRYALIEDGLGEPIRFEARGTVSLHAARIDKQLTCRGARLRATRVALDARLLDLGRSAQFDRQRSPADVEIRDSSGRTIGFDARGLVRLTAARVPGDLNFRGARLRPSDRIALEVRNVHVDDAFVWREVDCEGDVDLRNTEVGVLDDDPESWATGGSREQRTLNLEHFSYGALAAPRRWTIRRDWLNRQREYSPQPYSVLAQCYRRDGAERSARKISIERFNAQARRRPWRQLDLRRLPRFTLRWTIGHGYEPWRALVWALLLWALGWAVTSSAVSHRAMVPTRAPTADAHAKPRAATDCTRTDYPCLVPALYAADVLVPVVTLGQRENWRPNGPLRYRLIIAILTVAGWMLTTVVVAGFTGLVRRE